MARVADGTEPHLYEPGDYGRWHDMWFCRTPGNGKISGRPFTGNLSNHEVAEHDDGTITVSPSILVSSTWAGEPESWHGWLNAGVWSEC